MRSVFCTGTRTLIAAPDGRSEISYPEYVDTFVTEIDKPRLVKQIATVGY
jgi:putative NADH-flavin reductase